MTKPAGWKRESARHALAARGVKTGNTRAKYTAQSAISEDSLKLKQVSVPRILYHGTAASNLLEILEHGLKIGKEPTSWTLTDRRIDDTTMNISLANSMRDAVFFSVGSTGWGGDQAILEIDANMIPEDARLFIGRRPLFGRKGAFEYKFYSKYGLPAEAIIRVFIRSFPAQGGAIERWYTREELLAQIKSGQFQAKHGTHIDIFDR